MNIQGRLKAHASLLRKIRIVEQQSGKLSEGLVLPSTTDPSRDSVQSGKVDDPLPLRLHQVEVLRSELEKLYALRDLEHDELWNITGLLSDINELCVVRSYYFWLCDREEVAQQLFGCKDDFQQRRKHYLDRVSKHHSAAMAKLKEV